MGTAQAGQFHILYAVVLIEFLGVDHRAHGIQWHRAAGITGAAAARDNG